MGLSERVQLKFCERALYRRLSVLPAHVYICARYRCTTPKNMLSYSVKIQEKI